MAWASHESLSRNNLRKRIFHNEKQMVFQETRLTKTKFTMRSAILEQEKLEAEYEAKKLVRDQLSNETAELKEDIKVLDLEKLALSKKVAYVLNNIRCVELGYNLKEKERETYWKFAHELSNIDMRSLWLKRGLDFKLKSMKKWHSVPDMVNMNVQN